MSISFSGSSVDCWLNILSDYRGRVLCVTVSDLPSVLRIIRVLKRILQDPAPFALADSQPNVVTPSLLDEAHWYLRTRGDPSARSTEHGHVPTIFASFSDVRRAGTTYCPQEDSLHFAPNAAHDLMRLAVGRIDEAHVFDHLDDQLAGIVSVSEATHDDGDPSDPRSSQPLSISTQSSVEPFSLSQITIPSISPLMTSFEHSDHWIPADLEALSLSTTIDTPGPTSLTGSGLSRGLAPDCYTAAKATTIRPVTPNLPMAAATLDHQLIVPPKPHAPLPTTAFNPAHLPAPTTVGDLEVQFPLGFLNQRSIERPMTEYRAWMCANHEQLPTLPGTGQIPPVAPSGLAHPLASQVKVAPTGVAVALPNLLDRLVGPGVYSDIRFINIFLLTYQRFTSPRRLLVALLQRFLVAGEMNTKPSVSAQLRICYVLGLWATDYWVDFTGAEARFLDDAGRRVSSDSRRSAQHRTDSLDLDAVDFGSDLRPLVHALVKAPGMAPGLRLACRKLAEILFADSPALKEDDPPLPLNILLDAYAARASRPSSAWVPSVESETMSRCSSAEVFLSVEDFHGLSAHSSPTAVILDNTAAALAWRRSNGDGEYDGDEDGVESNESTVGAPTTVPSTSFPRRSDQSAASARTIVSREQILAATMAKLTQTAPSTASLAARRGQIGFTLAVPPPPTFTDPDPAASPPYSAFRTARAFTPGPYLLSPPPPTTPFFDAPTSPRSVSYHADMYPGRPSYASDWTDMNADLAELSQYEATGGNATANHPEPHKLSKAQRFTQFTLGRFPRSSRPVVPPSATMVPPPSSTLGDFFSRFSRKHSHAFHSEPTSQPLSTSSSQEDHFVRDHANGPVDNPFPAEPEMPSATSTGEGKKMAHLAKTLRLKKTSLHLPRASLSSATHRRQHAQATPAAITTPPTPVAGPRPLSAVVEQKLHHLRSLPPHVFQLTDPEAVARQLTYVEGRLFLDVDPRHLLRYIWKPPGPVATAVDTTTLTNTLGGDHPGHCGAAAATGNPRKDKRQFYRSVAPAFEHFNYISAWVASKVLSQSSHSERAKLVRYFLDVAEALLVLHNFNTLMAVMAGLKSHAVYRLHRTFDLVHQDPADVARLERLHHITSPERHYLGYHEQLQRAALPCIPFMGCALRDLVVIDESLLERRRSGRRQAPTTVTATMPTAPDQGSVGDAKKSYWVPPPSSSMRSSSSASASRSPDADSPQQQPELIWRKFEFIGDIILLFRKLQRNYAAECQIQPDDALIELLMSQPCLDEEELHALSIHREPRQT
ncbi:hypothetical protein IWQ60_005110 [Tieghemiomyces parasiticus]|uniref:Ras GEF n=1 Tax=Tieghemiomyces parasiticus TaxID=78921 RepID=A0A9W8DYR5_9FUNG|nr:hypothetical protein IWQ60_005110 [Tieghemiomyces parasiticus]